MVAFALTDAVLYVIYDDNTLFDTIGGSLRPSREHRAVVFESHRLLLGTLVRQHHSQPLAPSEE